MASQAPSHTTQPLQAPYNFDPEVFKPLTTYIKQQADHHNQLAADQKPSPYRACPVVAAYSSLQTRTSLIQLAPEDQQDDYQACVCLSSAARYFPSIQGGVGVIVSPMQNGAKAQLGYNNWHAVGVLRKGPTLWIFDSSYDAGSQVRLPMIVGTSNISRLIPSLGTITQIQVQGLGIAEKKECMGRAAQFVDNVLGVPGAVAPYPADTFVPGVQTAGWQVVSRS